MTQETPFITTTNSSPQLQAYTLQVKPKPDTLLIEHIVNKCKQTSHRKIG